MMPATNEFGLGWDEMTSEEKAIFAGVLNRPDPKLDGAISKRDVLWDGNGHKGLKKVSAEGAGHVTSNILDELHNDYGNGRRIIIVSGSALRYVHALKKFIVWNGRRWAVDSTEQAKKLATLALLEFLRQTIELKDSTAEKFAKQSLDEKRINAALALARMELSVQPSELDTDPFLLNFQNGTVDVRTGVIQPHNPDHFITKLVHFDYRPEAEAPELLKFLNRIMGAGASEASQIRAAHLIRFLQRAFGYSLTGTTSEKAVFILWGNGDNGKTTLLELFRHLLEEYAVLLQTDTLMARTHESNNTQADLADLRGARFVMTSETEEGQRLAEGKLKRITQGMGKIKAVRKYENPIEFPETHKLWIDANHRPSVRGTDNAIWNRLHLIPFTISIPKEEQDRGLPAKLRSEAEGVLAWAILGGQLWWKQGLGKPEEVAEAVAGWRDESDPLKNFIADCCALNPDSYCQVDQIRNAYGQWCDLNGEHPLDSRRFNKRLEALQCEQDRIKNGGKQYRIWRGITVTVTVTGDNR